MNKKNKLVKIEHQKDGVLIRGEGTHEYLIYGAVPKDVRVLTIKPPTLSDVCGWWTRIVNIQLNLSANMTSKELMEVVRKRLVDNGTDLEQKDMVIVSLNHNGQDGKAKKEPILEGQKVTK